MAGKTIFLCKKILKETEGQMYHLTIAEYLLGLLSEDINDSFDDIPF